MTLYLITSALQKEFHHLVLPSLSCVVNIKQLHVLTQWKISKFRQMCEEKIETLKKYIEHAWQGLFSLSMLLWATIQRSNTPRKRSKSASKESRYATMPSFFFKTATSLFELKLKIFFPHWAPQTKVKNATNPNKNEKATKRLSP